MRVDPLPELGESPPLPMWSVRWLVIGPMLGWLIGVSGLMIAYRGWWMVGALVVIVGAAVALVWWGRWMMRANLVAEMQHALCHRTYGPVKELGATVTIRPGVRGGGVGSLTVDLPPRGETNGQ